jgi:hypothetical protein
VYVDLADKAGITPLSVCAPDKVRRLVPHGQGRLCGPSRAPCGPMVTVDRPGLRHGV